MLSLEPKTSLSVDEVEGIYRCMNKTISNQQYFHSDLLRDKITYFKEITNPRQIGAFLVFDTLDSKDQTFGLIYKCEGTL